MTKNGFGKLLKVLTVSLVASLALGLLAGCNGNKASDKNEEKVLRIGTTYGGGDDSWFRQQYTDIFEYTNQNIKIEIVPAVDQSQYRYYDGTEPYVQPDYVDSMKKLMTGSNPVDIVIADTSTLKQLIQENLLKQLDPMIQEDKFDTTDFVPSVIDGLKDLGEGNLYALTPSFSSSALFFNKKIFTDAGVEPPTDKSTWDDIFAKARLVAKGEGKDRVYGFSFNRYMGSDPFGDMQYSYISGLQLKTYDEKAENMTVNSPQWVKVWETMSKLAKDKIIPDSNSNMNNSETWTAVSGDLFLSGKVAMTIGESNYVNEIADANNNASKIKNFTPVDWDVVTVPVHPEKPDVGGNVYLNNTFSINSSAPNADTAWEFIKFVNGPDFAKLKSRSNSYEMVSRKSFIQPKQGLNYNIQAFYLLKPFPPTNPKDDKLLVDKPGLYSINNVGRTYFQQVLENKKTPEEALNEWAEKGNKMLQEIKINPKTQFQEDGTPFIPEEGAGGVKY
ncbi:multiple sugar transport system substrate-binding protein [Fontibacillus phaseoli]|uniref:Multiple sugar transport system substrate-binding protein n=1 Tax=Fontibacillus phaseoli TaxID=1416533 RepID=A0A369BTC9_9BACL|nr:extracellular solute-binding protein [Fontibacillus phaseoli]RCX22864.1 multiple sugar transport system substrate-binding protein [Fontibacillus phaseoli]